jgi:hypothetical protein
MDNIPIDTSHCILIGLDGVDVRLLTGDHSLEYQQLSEIIGYHPNTCVDIGHPHRPKSGPGWCTILTGRDNHNCETNEEIYAFDTDNPNLIERLRNKGKSIQVFSSHAIIPRVLGVTDETLKNCNDAREGSLMFGGTNKEFKLWLSRGNDSRTTNLVLSTLDIKKTRPAELIFMHLDDIDHAHHNHTVDSSAVGNAVMATKLRVESVLDLVRRRSEAYCENWIVIFVTDHGRLMPEPGGFFWNFLKYVWFAPHGYCSNGERMAFISRLYFEHSTSSFTNYSQNNLETLRDAMPMIFSYVCS